MLRKMITKNTNVGCGCAGDCAGVLYNAYPAFMSFSPEGEIVRKTLECLRPSRFLPLVTPVSGPGRQYINYVN